MTRVLPPNRSTKPETSQKKQIQEPQTRKNSIKNAIVIVVVVAVIVAVVLSVVYFEGLIECVIGGIFIAVKGFCNIPWAMGKVDLSEPMMVGAITGIIIGWLRRGLYISQNGEKLLSAFISSHFWKGNPGHAILLFLIHAASGILVGLVLGSAGLFVPHEAIVNDPYLMTKVGFILEVGSGTGGGYEDFIKMLIILLVASIIIVLIAMVIINRALAFFILHSALRGGAGGFTKYLFTAYVEEWSPHVRWDHEVESDVREAMNEALATGFQHGIVTGAIFGTVMTVIRLAK